MIGKAGRMFWMAVAASLAFTGQAAGQRVTDRATAQEEPDAPDGRFQFLSLSGNTAFFVMLDRGSHQGNEAKGWLYQVHEPTKIMEGYRVTETLSEYDLRCREKQGKRITHAGFRSTNRPQIVAAPEKEFVPIRPGTIMNDLLEVVCEIKNPVRPVIFDGRTAVLNAARMAIRSNIPPLVGSAPKGR